MSEEVDRKLALDAAAHGIVIFEDRLILDAQPPIDEGQFAEIEKMVGGTIPAGLAALWRTAFGGQVSYALQAEFGGHVASFSFCEIFYPGSSHYHDLFGWIEHEFETAKEAGDAQAEAGVLRFLPFGGFEYTDRLYVCLEEGPDRGAVFAWMRGLPPAWSLNLHEDSVTRIADDVPALFRLLTLETDPFLADRGDYSEGSDMAEAIAEVRETDPDLADALAAKARKAVLDWRAALNAGTIASNSRLRRLALRHAGATGDLGLVDRLAAQGCDLNERYAGNGNLLDHMLLLGHDAAGAALIDRGVDPTNAILTAASALSGERTAQLLALGAAVNGVAARSAAHAGRLETAKLIADTLATRDPAQLAALPGDLENAAIRQEESATRVESGAMCSNLTPAQYRATAVDLRSLKRYVLTLLGGSPDDRRSWFRRLFGR